MKKKCPQCGKENIVRDRNDQGFCGKICLTNYRYDQTHKDRKF